VNSLPKTITRQRRGCALNPGPSAPESSMLTTRLPSHREQTKKRKFEIIVAAKPVIWNEQNLQLCNVKSELAWQLETASYSNLKQSYININTCQMLSRVFFV